MRVIQRSCPCGSGRLARNCCGRFRRLGEQEVAMAHLARQGRAARDLIGPFSPTALAALQAEAATLPERCDDFTNALIHAGDSVRDAVARLSRLAPRSRGDGSLEAAVTRADTPAARVAVAKAIVTMRENGEIDEHLAAAALVELNGIRSPLTQAALMEAAYTLAGIHAAHAHLRPAPTVVPQPATA